MDRNKLVEAYRLMLLSRAIDEACVDLAHKGVAVPNYHGARGQEALYAGVGVALQPADQLLYNYRAFATLLAKGITLEELAADLLMNARGTSRGHGGIMHVTAPERGIPGRNGVFGSKFGIALGLAQEIVLHRRQAAVVCMFGEAEGNRGGLYEAMNIAALRTAPDPLRGREQRLRGRGSYRPSLLHGRHVRAFEWVSDARSQDRRQ